MNSPLPTISVVRFHISLNVKDLHRSVAFYKTLFDREPAKLRPDYAKFEPDDPPLVLSLEPNGATGPGALNHLGIRLANSQQLVAIQERLERNSIRSQREEGVECCYAKQTKFWVQDPDGTLWEFYTLDDDHLDHRGAGQVPAPAQKSNVQEPPRVWQHMLGHPIPKQLGFPDQSVEEIQLQGSFNVPLSSDEQKLLLGEAVRVLKPNGRVLVRMLVGDKVHRKPKLPGIAALVRYVPTIDDVLTALRDAGLANLRLLKFDDHPRFVVDGVGMRETLIEATASSPKPLPASASASPTALASP